MRSATPASARPPRKTTQDTIAVGSRLRLARWAAGLTQTQLAVRLGMSTTMICFVERGLSSFSMERLARVTTILQISLDWLLKGIGVGPDMAVGPSIRRGRPPKPRSRSA